MGSQSIGVAYAGKLLQSGRRVFWTVQVWDREGRKSRESAPSWWEMGLVEGRDWQGHWIGDGRPAPAKDEEFYGDRPAPCFRREFVVKRPMRRARAYVTGLGYYEMTLNGQRVGDHLLDPAWTNYDRRVFYSSYDVSKLLKQGRNAAGLLLGNGWYNTLPLRIFSRFNLRTILPTGEPRALLQLNIEYDDGSREAVVTDENWRVAESPIRSNSLYLGEIYDARKEMRDWDLAGFDDHAWKTAAQVDAPKGKLMPQPLPPIRAGKLMQPVKVTEPKPGLYIVDMGQNFAGVAAFRFNAPAGTTVKIRYAELLNPDGTLNPLTSVAGQIKNGNGGPGAPPIAWQTDTYICKGGGPESCTPRFTWHGFRYIEISGLSSPPSLSSIVGHPLHSDVESVGEFACSNPLFNRIQEMVRWTILSNIFSVESDCPHRERLGYGGDIVAAGEAIIYNFDMSRFYSKAVDDLADSVRPNGGMTETAPFVGIADESLGEGAGPIGWGTAFPHLQWQLYQYYGDRAPLTTYYDMTRAWIRLLESRADGGILVNGISDHESLVPKPVPLTGTAFYYYNVELAARIAGTLMHNADLARYETLAQSIRAAFNGRFLKPETGAYFTGTQACQAFALYMDLAPPAQKQEALAVLVRDIMDNHKGHLTTGIFGTKYMLNALTDTGRADVAYELANQKTFPGWGYMLENGATTLWEHWAKEERVYSHNHPMFGSISEWFFKGLAGIRLADAGVEGMRQIRIAPNVVGDLTWVRASYDSVRGRISSAWKRDGGSFVLEVAVPPGIQAAVEVPANDPTSVKEANLLARDAEGVKYVGARNGSAIFHVGSGVYRFTSVLPQK